MIECLTEKALAELESGVEHIDTCEFGAVVDMIKDLNEAEYRAVIVKSMKEADEEEKEYDKELLRALKEEYGEEGGRRYYDNYRYKTSGRFAPRGKGSYMPRRGYEEPPYYHMMPYEMSVNEYKMYSPEQLRDLDRKNGKLYYTPMVENKVVNSRYDNARKWYSESKQLHKGNTPEDNTENMKNLEKILNIIAEDVKEYMPNMSPSEKSLTKQKIEGISKSIQ